MKSCVIISGHSRGLGRALTELYLRKGRTVIGLSRKGWEDSPEKLVEYSIDFTNPEALSVLLRSASWQNNLSDIDELILINNAGTVEPTALAGLQDSEAIIHAININVTAPILLTNAVIAMATQATDIRIAHISSGAGRHAISGWSVYGATKAALDQHAAVIATEQHKHIRIASIAPGVVDTDMQQNIRAADAKLFPDVQNFINMKANNKLQGTTDTAQSIATMMAAAEYGQVVKRDVRE